MGFKAKHCAVCGNRVRFQKPFTELMGWSNIRKRLFETRGRSCERCGWAEVNPFTGHIPVQVDHKDGNRKNNQESNLVILCPNCHAMTEHFMFYGRTHKGTYGQKGTQRPR